MISRATVEETIYQRAQSKLDLEEKMSFTKESNTSNVSTSGSPLEQEKGVATKETQLKVETFKQEGTLDTEEIRKLFRNCFLMNFVFETFWVGHYCTFSTQRVNTILLFLSADVIALLHDSLSLLPEDGSNQSNNISKPNGTTW